MKELKKYQKPIAKSELFAASDVIASSTEIDLPPDEFDEG